VSNNHPTTPGETAAALLERAVALHKEGRLADAEPLYRAVLVTLPRDFDALHLLGVVRHQRGDHAAALELIDRAIAINFAVASAHSHRGLALQGLKRFEEALQAYDRALTLKPESVEALFNRGRVLLVLRQLADALKSFDAALALAPDFAEAHLYRGNTLQDLNALEAALKSHDRALELKSDFPDALNDRGLTLLGLRRWDEAFRDFNRALALKPVHAQALCNRGKAFFEMRNLTEALADFDRALAVDPDMAEALNNRATALFDLKRYSECAATLSRLLALFPDFDYALGAMFHAQRSACDWTNFAETSAEIVSGVVQGKKSDLPFALLTHSTSAGAQLSCAGRFTHDKYPAAAKPLWTGETYRHDRIRIAYLSADFHNHPVAYLMAEVFERHDATRFEVAALSFGPSDSGEMRRRLERAIPTFIGVDRLNDRAAAELLRKNEIDIAVDLKGFTTDCRPGILAYRPCPVQVSYLGFPGTVGAGYIDYIIADRHVIPKDHDAYFREKVVRLPDSLQPNDRKRRIAERIPSRTELGLPENGFVFCCFNASHKLNPSVFDIWMRLLKKVDGSVLWLAHSGEASENLKREAERHGVPATLLVFAPRVGELAEHLAREKQADLFLDTYPYNAHATASDALWAGIPLITCAGETFASRVGMSLLHAIGLPELIVTDLASYEALALKLATTPSLLRSIRARLKQNRDIKPLFDSVRFTRHIEAAYVTMYERQQRGEKPAAFDVPPIDA